MLLRKIQKHQCELLLVRHWHFILFRRISQKNRFNTPLPLMFYWKTFEFSKSVIKPWSAAASVWSSNNLLTGTTKWISKVEGPCKRRVIPYLKKIQKTYELHDTLLDFCWHQRFFTGNQQILLYQEIQI